MYEITKLMNQEHTELTELFRGYQSLKSQAPDQARCNLEIFTARLMRHMALEEEILFPRFEAFSRLGTSGPTTVMRSEHRKIREALEKLHACHTGITASEKIEHDLLDALRSHEAMEDMVFGPWIDDNLSETERLGLFEQIRHYPSTPSQPLSR